MTGAPFRPIAVDLDGPELWEALVFAKVQRAESIRLRLKDRHGAALRADTTEVAWRENNGACGHRAACKALGYPWAPVVNSFHDADIPPDLAVRTRDPSRFHDPELCWRIGDPPAHRYVLVVGRLHRFTINGWAYGTEVAQSQWRAGESDLYYLPNHLLRDPRELRAP